MQAYLNKRGGNKKKPAVFLDRDGTLIHDRPGHYLTDPAKLRLYKCTVKALKILSALGFRLIVLTNQSGIARGYMTQARSRQINLKLVSALESEKVFLDAIYFCPHSPDAGCLCRKPLRGLADEALMRQNIILSQSWVIGDKLSDLKLAQRLGIKAIFVKTGHGAHQLKSKYTELKTNIIKKDLLSAAQYIKKQTEL